MNLQCVDTYYEAGDKYKDRERDFCQAIVEGHGGLYGPNEGDEKYGEHHPRAFHLATLTHMVESAVLLRACILHSLET